MVQFQMGEVLPKKISQSLLKTQSTDFPDTFPLLKQ